MPIGYLVKTMIARKRLFLLAASWVFALSACATIPRLYTEQELGSLATACGYALGEVVQDPEEKRLLLVLTAVPTSAGERQCIYAWARPRRLHVVYANVQAEGAE